MESKRPHVPIRHTAYPRRAPRPKTHEPRPPAAQQRTGPWARAVPEGRRFPRA